MTALRLGEVDGPWLSASGSPAELPLSWLVSQRSRSSSSKTTPKRGGPPRLQSSEGLTVEIAGGPDRAAELASTADLVVPSPGVPVGHPAVAAAFQAGIEVLSEIELAWQVLDAARRDRGERYGLVAITGTNGKTTVTKLVAAMLSCSGKNAVAAGNVGFPLLEAVTTLAPGTEAVLVAEVSSFQLEYTPAVPP